MLVRLDEALAQCASEECAPLIARQFFSSTLPEVVKALSARKCVARGAPRLRPAAPLTPPRRYANAQEHPEQVAAFFGRVLCALSSPPLVDALTADHVKVIDAVMDPSTSLYRRYGLGDEVRAHGRRGAAGGC